ncbi:hypothetical protein [Sorangium sp. So ce1000]|uniref:hypothetical protein n=1 Tax=Sorangium sp. So ce1000 TaxID=3133325 RepID=UPI003F60F3D4
MLIAALGRPLRAGINDRAARGGFPLRIVGYDALLFFLFAEDLAVHTRRMNQLLGAMARRGVLLRVRRARALPGAAHMADVVSISDSPR